MDRTHTPSTAIGLHGRDERHGPTPSQPGIATLRKALLLAAASLLILPGIVDTAFAAAAMRISVSVLPQACFVERVAGSHATVHVMIPKGANPETYEPTPQSLVALTDSRIYVKVGAPGLPFEERYLRTAFDRNRQLTVVNMSDGLKFREGDPHVWTSPAAVRIAVQNIARVLIAQDPTNAGVYRSNLRAVLQEIETLDREIRQALSKSKGYAFMVFHPAWGYFADEYGLVQLAIEEEGKPVNAGHIRQMVDLARSKGIRAIFIQKGFDSKSARAVAREIGGEILETDPLAQEWFSGMRSFTRLLAPVLKK